MSLRDILDRHLLLDCELAAGFANFIADADCEIERATGQSALDALDLPASWPYRTTSDSFWALAKACSGI